KQPVEFLGVLVGRAICARLEARYEPGANVRNAIGPDLEQVTRWQLVDAGQNRTRTHDVAERHVLDENIGIQLAGRIGLGEEGGKAGGEDQAVAIEVIEKRLLSESVSSEPQA